MKWTPPPPKKKVHEKQISKNFKTGAKTHLGRIILNVLILLVGEKFLKEIKIAKDKEFN